MKPGASLPVPGVSLMSKKEKKERGGRWLQTQLSTHIIMHKDGIRAWVRAPTPHLQGKLHSEGVCWYLSLSVSPSLLLPYQFISVLFNWKKKEEEEKAVATRSSRLSAGTKSSSKPGGRKRSGASLGQSCAGLELRPHVRVPHQVCLLAGMVPAWPVRLL